MSPLTIMVVDDDSDSRAVVEHRLRKMFKDCAVVACGSASEALCLFKYGSIDAIITDHHLGVESGCEADPSGPPPRYRVPHSHGHRELRSTNGTRRVRRWRD
jgi:hypothetical protein